jgi:uncharacterized membrane protein
VASEDAQLKAGEVDGRTLALSDGVFAIAMTLLVLAIHDPEPARGQSLASALWDQKGEVLAWVWSFAVLIGLWSRHCSLFAHLSGLDARITQLNLIYLGVIAFVPYPTSVLAKFSGETAAVALYAGTLAIASLLTGEIVRQAVRKGFLSRAYAGAMNARRWVLVAGVQLLAIPLSIPFGSAAFFVWFLLPWAIRPVDAAA